MLFDLGWSELLLIGIVALIFIGPKDLPKALKVAGFWVRKARTLSREFQSSIDQMIREAELDEMRQELKKATELDLDKEFRNTIDPKGELAEALKPPELPDFSEPAKPAPAEHGEQGEAVAAPTAPEPSEAAAATATAEPSLPAPEPAAVSASPEAAVHDLVPPKP
jgi:sec-independent protein translocase protein TatB